MTRSQAIETLKTLKCSHDPEPLKGKRGDRSVEVGATGKEGVSLWTIEDLNYFWNRFSHVESALRCIYPLMPFHREARKKTQRACFGWDGLRVANMKAMDLPLVTVGELEAALDGLIDDAIEIVPQVYP